jgi:hypothetical protein
MGSLKSPAAGLTDAAILTAPVLDGLPRQVTYAEKINYQNNTQKNK